ncbi:MAG TPA: cytochrome c [Edaphobacter sp.]
MAKKGGGGFGKLLLGFLFGVAAVLAAGYAWLYFGDLPVAVSDAALPFEKQLVRVPLHQRIAREKKEPPFGPSEDAFEGGARVYRVQCAACHGTPSHDASFAHNMFPPAPPLWKKHGRRGVVGVSDDDAGVTYWKIANGIRLTGMPAYKGALSDTEMWQVAVLLKNADQDLPDPVRNILNGK